MSILDDIAARIWKPPFCGSVSEWCEQHLTFAEAGNNLAFTTDGREFVREILADGANSNVTDETLVFGSQTGKTVTLMAYIAWSVINDPSAILWATGNIDLARDFSRGRFMPMLRASPCFNGIIPVGARRHDFSTLSLAIGASHIKFVGSNSPTGLSSKPCRRVILDEVDKFPESPKGEADAVSLAEQRTKGQSSAQRWKTSTPVFESGLIWTEFLKGDRRRYNLPCPQCGGIVVLAWSKAFSWFPLLGNEAFVHWDVKAKHDREWDLDQVAATAHAKCPHCQGRIEDRHKRAMLAGGKWIATSSAASGIVSRHLPSMYSVSPECSFGAMARRFLQAKHSPSGLQGFINGDLAEPYSGQDKFGDHTAIIVKERQSGDDWIKLMAVDVQRSAPHFWYVVRAWKKGEGAEAVKAGSCDNWEDMVRIKNEHGVKDNAVIIDSGHDTKAVYVQCGSTSAIWDNGGRPVMRTIIDEDGKTRRICMLRGWIPAKGMQGKTTWKDDEDGLLHSWKRTIIDPFEGEQRAGKFGIILLGFASDTYQDVLDNLMRRRTRFRWMVGPGADSKDYWHQMESEAFDFGKGRWVKRADSWPNHLRDCEKMQVVLATYYGLINIEPNAK